MSSLLRILATLVVVSFVAACGEALPTDVDAPEPHVAGEEYIPECDPDHPDFDPDMCEGWLGSGG